MVARTASSGLEGLLSLSRQKASRLRWAALWEAIPASWHGGWGQQPRVQVLPLVPPQLFPAWLPEASAGVGDESEPGGEDEAWGPDVITTSLRSVVFSKCTFFGGRLGQRQRLVPVPHQCHQEGVGTKPFAVPKPKPLLLATGGARAMNYPYLHPVGLGQGLAHSRAGRHKCAWDQ